MENLSGTESDGDIVDYMLPDVEDQLEAEDENNGEVLGADGAARRPVLGIQPYQFEPLLPADAVPVDGGIADEEDREGRLGNNDWCSCSGGCVPMPKVVESFCCKEVNAVVAKMDEYEEAELDCITAHPGFRSVCLDIWVLDTAYLQYRQQYGNQVRLNPTVNQKRRHIAYRQLARFCWGYLGRWVRVPLPSCAVNHIRTRFPSEQYTGFEDA